MTLCRLCDLYEAAEGSAWCSSICADLELGAVSR